MGVRLNPYLNFRATAAEAMAFYRDVFGGDLSTTTFREGGMEVPDAELDLVMHSQLAIDDTITLMAADAPSHVPGEVHNGTISLFGDDEGTLRRWWDGLARGATVTMDLQPAPWGDTFGMLTDRYGVDWMVDVTGGGS